jgi:hypothetical protein
MISATAVMIHQLVFDLYECVGAAWALVATRTVQKLVPLCVFGRSPDLDASLHSSASMLSCDRNDVIELKSGTQACFSREAWLPQIVCPTFIGNEMAGALIFGPKMLEPQLRAPQLQPKEYTVEEKELVLEFARHISKLLHKDPRAGNR